MNLGRDGWGGGGFGSSYGGARGGGPMRGDYGSRDSGPYGGQFDERILKTSQYVVLGRIKDMKFLHKVSANKYI